MGNQDLLKSDSVKDMKPVLDSKGRSYGTGRRKEASAKVRIKPGRGNFVVNKKDALQYLKRDSLYAKICEPFVATSSLGLYDVEAQVIGGGLSGQAGALSHGISRALVNMNPAFRTVLRQGGFLTRDSRVVERKKYGQHKARKKCQFSKR